MTSRTPRAESIMIGKFWEWFVCLFLARLFSSRFRELSRADGRPFFRQFKIIAIGKENPRGVPPWWHVSVFFQSFLLEDDPGTFHIHRWGRMVSFGLSGELTEQRHDRTIVHQAPFIYTMNSNVVHRAAGVAPRTWTLFIMIGRNRNHLPGGWGYYDRTEFGWENYRPWNEVRSANVAPIAGMVKS